jgi:hypothetical protein
MKTGTDLPKIKKSFDRPQFFPYEFTFIRIFIYCGLHKNTQYLKVSLMEHAVHVLPDISITCAIFKTISK